MSGYIDLLRNVIFVWKIAMDKIKVSDGYNTRYLWTNSAADTGQLSLTEGKKF
jgi:hypothetical protein